MRVLIIGRYKPQFEHHLLPFVIEQGDALKKAGCIVDFLPIQGKGLSAYFSTKALKQKINTFQPDIIHAHYGLSGITAVLQNSVPVVTTFHNGETLNWYVNLLTSLFALKAQHVISVAEHIYQKLYFKNPKFTILPCGVNLAECQITEKQEARHLLGFQDNKKYILFGGAFSNKRKNYELLEQSLHIIADSNIETLEMRGLSRNDISLRLSACDLFALPTKSEGSPQALKEAMACNCPIMATDVADIKHLLGDIPGHFICSFNPQEVASTLSTALRFPNRTKGRERIIELELDNDHIAQRLIAIYESVLSQHSPTCLEPQNKSVQSV